MNLKHRNTAALALLGAFVFLGETARAMTQLNASGSTFIFPIESVWSRVYEKIDRNTRINYQPIGSGGGIGQLMQGLTDFAGSDAPLTDEQIAKAPGRILHFPAVLGADVLVRELFDFSRWGAAQQRRELAALRCDDAELGGQEPQARFARNEKDVLDAPIGL